METFLTGVVESTIRSMWHSRWFILLGVTLSVAVTLLVDQGSVARGLSRAGVFGILAATGLGVLSPLCSCSNVPLVAGILAAGVPLSTVMPFMIASPMTSPLAFGVIAGYLGVKFAAFQMAAVAALGMGTGLVVLAGERSGLLSNQSRLAPEPRPAAAPRPIAGGSGSGCCGSGPSGTGPTRAGGCGTAAGATAASGQTAGSTAVPAGPARVVSPGLEQFLRRAWRLALQRAWSILKILFFMGLLGGAIARLVPTSQVVRWFGAGSSFSVPLAALLGLPAMISSQQALPLLSELAQKGLSGGAALAFLMTGPGACIQSLAATWAIAKPRMFAVYVGLLLVGSMVAGLAYNVILGPTL